MPSPSICEGHGAFAKVGGRRKPLWVFDASLNTGHRFEFRVAFGGAIAITPLGSLA
jgi:hypothetical protein